MHAAHGRKRAILGATLLEERRGAFATDRIVLRQVQSWQNRMHNTLCAALRCVKQPILSPETPWGNLIVPSARRLPDKSRAPRAADVRNMRVHSRNRFSTRLSLRGIIIQPCQGPYKHD